MSLKELQYPISPEVVLRKRAGLKRELLAQPAILEIKVAILGGSTTSEVRSMLELFLLAHGIRPSFYESAYAAYYEEVLFERPELWNFRPDVVLVHTNWRNVLRFPELLATESRVEDLVRGETDRFERFWNKINNSLGALIIQNNFDPPQLCPFGNLEGTSPFGRVRFLRKLNEAFAGYASRNSRFLINDISHLSAQLGLASWSDPSYWYNYHMAVTPLAALAIATNVASIIKSVYGRSKKCLILDLDNTLWGGVIGDAGVEHICLGRDNALGEAFCDFQKYVKELRQRGIMLAVCSKNDLENAKQGFLHPDSVLHVNDFAAFKANWSPKPDNVRAIAEELRIGLDALVFVDDNPAERAIVSAQLPAVAVPDVGSDVTRFAQIIESERYFEPTTLSSDDLNRAAFYRTNAERNNDQERFTTYGEFLTSLQMTADIGPFLPIYIQRITQLVNKTNQFNLTTHRYTIAEIETIAAKPEYVALCGRLTDRFGDNGLVSVIIGSRRDETLHIDAWLMSCRVLSRDMELSMCDALVEACQQREIRTILGTYIPSAKNGLVKEHYRALGFTRIDEGGSERSVWRFDIPPEYQPKSLYIQRRSEQMLSRVAS